MGSLICKFSKLQLSQLTHIGLECPPKLLSGKAGTGPVEVSLKELNRIL